MKKIIIMAAVLFLPLFASAANLSNSFSIGTLFPLLGGTTSVSSSCGSFGSNNNVSFSLLQNGISTPLPTNLSTDSSGAFSGNVTFPATFSSDPAVLVATCNKSGDTINSPTLTFAAPLSSNFSLQQNQPTVGGLLNIAGACGNTNGLGTVQINLNSNGSNYPLNNFTLTSSGTFSGGVVIPNNINTGSATLTAVCSNTATFSSSLNIGQVAVNSFALASYPVLGTRTNISGNCTNVSSNANGNVSFAIMRNGIFYTLPATQSQTNSSGFFNSSVLFPSNIGNDPATIIITCPNNSTFSNVIMFGSVLGAVSPTPTPVFPVGGVAAGTSSERNSHYFIAAEFLLALGLAGLAAYRGSKMYAKK